MTEYASRNEKRNQVPEMYAGLWGLHSRNADLSKPSWDKNLDSGGECRILESIPIAFLVSCTYQKVKFECWRWMSEIGNYPHRNSNLRHSLQRKNSNARDKCQRFGITSIEFTTSCNPIWMLSWVSGAGCSCQV